MLRKVGLTGGIAIVMLAALVGFYATELTSPKAPSSSPTPSPNPTSEAGVSLILDERLAQVAEQWPGFGGYYLSRAKVHPPYEYLAYVYMLDGCQHLEAEQVVKQILYPERFGQDILGVLALQGDYSIAQLSQWYEHVSRIADPGLVLANLDESRNRLEIIVVDDAAAQRVEEKLKEIPVPPEAVAVRMREPVKLYESPREAVQPTELKEQLSDALLEDLETIAQQKGISLEAAIERYGSQGSFLGLVDTIRETFPDDYAWARVGLGGRGWVGFAGRPPDAALWMIDGFVNKQWGASVEVHSHVGFNGLERQSATIAYASARSDAPEVGMNNTGLDAETGHLMTTIGLHGAACDAAVIDDFRSSATKALIDATGADILNSVKTDVQVHLIAPSRGNKVDGPVLTSPEPNGFFGVMDAIVRGTVVFDEKTGCLYLGSSNSKDLHPVVWPAGASWQADPPAVKLQGPLIEPGMSVEGGGGYVSYGSIRNVAGVAVADAAQICADHVDTESIAFFNVGSGVELVP